MRGASALGELIAKYPDARIRVQAVWIPVVQTDKGPPDASVTAPLDDPRVEWYWDEKRLLVPRMVERTIQLHKMGRAVPLVEPGDLMWDVIVAFDPGVRWEDPFPAPSWYGMEAVFNTVPMVERRLKEASVRPAP
ncbi:MAG: hypothetical protein ACREAA_07860 [Candidatus Polarisedimenticolia bacterium]